MDFAEFDIEFITAKMAENPQSPLFARLADLYITANKANESQKLCEEGIQQFPDYYAGHLVLGKVYLHFQEYSKAKLCFERALELSPFNQTIKKYLKELPTAPDSSTRVNDETYFSPQENTPKDIEENTSPEAAPDSSEGETFSAVSMEEPLPSLFDMVTEEESQTVEEKISTDDQEIQQNEFIEASQETPLVENVTIEETLPQNEEIQPQYQPFAPEPVFETSSLPINAETIELPEKSSFTTQHESLGTFDDYFAQHINDVTTTATISLDDYLNNRVPAELLNSVSTILETPTQTSLPAPVVEETFSAKIEPVIEETPSPVYQQHPESIEEPQTNFDVLTAKLQNAERIKPQENYESSEPAKPVENTNDSDMVTPTLAEIYASQGEFNAAMQAYEILMLTQPENVGKYQKRVAELQQKQLEKEGLA